MVGVGSVIVFEQCSRTYIRTLYHPVVADHRLPEPPPPPQRRARIVRQRALDRATVVEAAVRVLDAEGLEAVTLRRVAHGLGVGAASLYAYVDSKDMLVELMLDHVLGEVDLSDLPDERPWKEQIKDVIRRMHATFVAHGDIGRATLGRIPSGANALRATETMLAVLRRSDLPDQIVAYAVDLIGLLVGAAAFEDSLFKSGVGYDEMLRFIGEFGRYLESLPPDLFPNLVGLAGPLTRISPDEDERFEFMLNVIVDGLAAQR
jgi:AcrR family transcriptional regulator